MRLLNAIFLMLILACAKPPVPVPLHMAKAPGPDWVELAGVRVEGQVRVSAQELRQAPFSPLEGKVRLLVYEYPQVKQLTIPSDPMPRDIAFFDIGGRAIDVFSRVSCPHPACQPLKSRFDATSVLIAPVGTFEKVGLGARGQMRWGKPSMSPTPPQLTAVNID